MRRQAMAARLERQWRDGAGLADRQHPVNMRKKLASARVLPSELWAQIIRLECDEQETGHAGEMPGRGFSHLVSSGKMNESIAQVGGRAGIGAARLSLEPFAFGGDLVNQGHGVLATTRKTSRHGRPGEVFVPRYQKTIPYFRAPGIGPDMFSHKQVWAAIDAIADRYGFSASGLAKKA